MYCCGNQEKNNFITWTVFQQKCVLDLYKREVSVKCYQAHIDLFNTQNIEDEQKSAPENNAVDKHTQVGIYKQPS